MGRWEGAEAPSLLWAEVVSGDKRWRRRARKLDGETELLTDAKEVYPELLAGGRAALLLQSLEDPGHVAH